MSGSLLEKIVENSGKAIDGLSDFMDSIGVRSKSIESALESLDTVVGGLTELLDDHSTGASWTAEDREEWEGLFVDLEGDLEQWYSSRDELREGLEDILSSETEFVDELSEPLSKKLFTSMLSAFSDELGGYIDQVDVSINKLYELDGKNIFLD